MNKISTGRLTSSILPIQNFIFTSEVGRVQDKLLSGFKKTILKRLLNRIRNLIWFNTERKINYAVTRIAVSYAVTKLCEGGRRSYRRIGQRQSDRPGIKPSGYG